MRYLLFLTAFLLCSCNGMFGSVQQYEPSMDEVRAEADTLHAMLDAADVNNDGRLNWWEATLVISAWLDQMQPDEEPGGDTDGT